MDQTHYSRDDEPAEDRHSRQRTTTVYRPVLVEAEDITGFCLLRNISPEGMMGRFFTRFAVNTPVSVQFNAEITSRGKVCWSREGMIGIEFASCLRPDEEVAVVLGGMAPKKAVIRWTQAQLAGLNFLQPLAFDQLGERVVQRFYASTPSLAGSTGQENDAETAPGTGLI